MKILIVVESHFKEYGGPYTAIIQKIEYLKQICGYCESILKQINNRTFQIKNAIDWKKFTMGSM